MPKKTALIDYSLCQPGLCQDGWCKAADACLRKVLVQEERYEMPDPPMMCVGCGACTTACPQKAVKMI